VLLIVALIAAVLAPQTVPDLSGTWTRDPGRSTATGGGQGHSTITYALNGTKTTNAVSAGRNSGGTAAYVTSWRGARLETTVKVVPVDGRGRTATFREVRYLDADGSLVVETTMTGSSEQADRDLSADSEVRQHVPGRSVPGPKAAVSATRLTP
jgi:hypothetical protein